MVYPKEIKIAEDYVRDPIAEYKKGASKFTAHIFKDYSWVISYSNGTSRRQYNWWYSDKVPMRFCIQKEISVDEFVDRENAIKDTNLLGIIKGFDTDVFGVFDVQMVNW